VGEAAGVVGVGGETEDEPPEEAEAGEGEDLPGNITLFVVSCFAL